MTEKTNGVHGPLIDVPAFATEEEAGPDPAQAKQAKQAIGLILDGKAPSAHLVPEVMGWYGPYYQQILDAYYQSGLEGARFVFQSLAEDLPAIAALRLSDPKIQQRFWSVEDLYNTEFPEPRYVIPGLLPTGLAALGARPKIGKSWLALQISSAVGIGGLVFEEQVEQGKVLYLALEDSHRRIKNRLRKQGAPGKTNIKFVFTWPPLIGDGIRELDEQIERQGYSLVVIDTLARSLGNSDPNKQAEQGMLLGALQRIAIDRDITILLIDHHRKGNGGDGDVVDDMLGATSKTGVQDVVWGLYRERGQKTATFKVTGRDIEERELALTFDRDTGLWHSLGDAETLIKSEQAQAILDAIKELGSATNSEIAAATNQDRSNCHKRILDLVEAGRLKKLDVYPARYALCDKKTND